jgi:hypothetical protein
MKPILAVLLLFTISGFSADEHPLDPFFSAEVLPDEDAKKVKTHFEISERSPYLLEMEMYHTNLKNKILGALVEVESKSLNLSYEVIFQVSATPYLNVSVEVPLFRGDEIIKGEPTFTIKEFRYEELPDIEDPSKEEEDDDDS